MRKALAALTLCSVLGISGAQAADLAPVYKAPPLPPEPIFTWTGFYLGGNIGGAWAQRNVHDSLFGLSFDRTTDGRFIGGGQVGYNYQFNSFVLGVEADIDGIAGDNRVGPGIVVPAVGTIQVSAGNNSWLSTAAVRFGFANGQWLFYGKAGGGWVNTGGLTVTNLTTGTSIVTSGRTASGGMLGAGIEYAFAPSWSGKLEYDYIGLGSRSFVIPAGSPFLVGDVITRSYNVQMVKLGLNYHFNYGPISARY